MKDPISEASSSFEVPYHPKGDPVQGCRAQP